MDLPAKTERQQSPFAGRTTKEESELTSKMIPLRTSFESTPTFRSSRHSLSNFSGVSLLSMLQGMEGKGKGGEREEGQRNYTLPSGWLRCSVLVWPLEGRAEAEMYFERPF